MSGPKLFNWLTEVSKPARYTGGELNAVHKDSTTVELRMALAFPDVYEIAMSHLGIKILYEILNAIDWVWAERVFTPWPDMAERMVKESVPLYALESGDPLTAFDVIGFTLQYELSYSNILYMLYLAESYNILRSARKTIPITPAAPCLQPGTTGRLLMSWS